MPTNQVDAGWIERCWDADPGSLGSPFLQEFEARLTEVSAPGGLPEAVVSGLDRKLAIAAGLARQHGGIFVHERRHVMDGIPHDEPAGGDKESHIDALIERSKKLLGDDGYRVVFEAGLASILADIADDLEEFGVHYDVWYSEQTLSDRNLINKAVQQLQDAGHIYENKGALWFRSTDFGDEKDRVVIRDNGQATYFASDIAYHMDKFTRGFHRVINIWGADHHGYVPRVKAAITALGEDDNKLDILLVKFAILYRSGERVQMSTRSGSFVTLRELLGGATPGLPAIQVLLQIGLAQGHTGGTAIDDTADGSAMALAETGEPAIRAHS